MSPNHKEMIPQYLQAIAKKEGLSENDVRNEIALAIYLALAMTRKFRISGRIFPAMGKVLL